MTHYRDQLKPFSVTAPTHYFMPRPRNANQRCYELAGRFAIDNEGAILVHGIVEGWLQHAWAEIDGLVYDGPAGGLYTMSDYYRIMEANPVRKFGRKQMAKFVDEYSGSWGPWYPPRPMSPEIKKSLLAHRGHGKGNTV